MPESVQSQWVVRSDVGITRLSDKRFQLRIFTVAEIASFRSYNIDNKQLVDVVDWRKRLNELRQSTEYAYWVCSFSSAPESPMSVLCCTVHRETADRILDSLWSAMFTNCGDNTYVDLRELLAADLVTPEQIVATPAAGRFVDLGDGSSSRTVVATGSIATADIPVQRVLTGSGDDRDVRWSEAATIADASTLWRRGVGGSIGHANAAMLNVADFSGIEMRTAAAATRSDPMQAVPPQQATPPEFTPSNPTARRGRLLEVEDLMRHSTVPNIGRSWPGNAELSPQERDRIQVQVQAALMRQQAENRNTRAVILPSGVNYSDYLQPLDFSDVPPAPPDNDAVDRADTDPDF